MKNFTLNDIKQLVEESLKEEPTGDAWLDAQYNEHINIVGHTQPYYRLFYRLAQKLKPRVSVELGSWRADAAIHLAKGNPDGYVLTLDWHREDTAARETCLARERIVKNMKFIPSCSWEPSSVNAVRDCAPISILYVDAWHDYEYVTREWQLYSPMLEDKALVICDDITTAHSFEGMLRFWDELPGEKFLDGRVHPPDIPMGFLLFRRNR